MIFKNYNILKHWKGKLPTSHPWHSSPSPPCYLCQCLSVPQSKGFIIIFELLLTHPSSTLENPISSIFNSSSLFGKNSCIDLSTHECLSSSYSPDGFMAETTTWLLSNISVLSVMSTPHLKLLHKDMQLMRTQKMAQSLKRAGCSSRRPGLGSYQPPRSFQLSKIPVPGNLIYFLTPWALGMHVLLISTCRQYTQMHVDNKSQIGVSCWYCLCQ